MSIYVCLCMYVIQFCMNKEHSKDDYSRRTDKNSFRPGPTQHKRILQQMEPVQNIRNHKIDIKTFRSDAYTTD